MAIFRPRKGKWLIKGPEMAPIRESTGNAVIQHGQKFDIPVPGNYFGDGVRLAVFRV